MEDPELEIISEWNIKRILYALIVLILLVIYPAYYFSSINDDSEEATPPTTVKKSVIDNQDSVKQATVNKPVVETPVKIIPAETTPVQVPVKEIIPEKNPVHTPAKGVISKQANIKITAVAPPEKVVKESEQEDNAAKHVKPNPVNSTSDLNSHISRAQLAQGVNKLEPFGEIKLPILVDTSKAYEITYFTEVINMQGDTVFHEWLQEGNSVYKRKINIRGNRWRISTSKLFPYNSTGQWQVRIITQQGDVLNKVDFSVEKR